MRHTIYTLFTVAALFAAFPHTASSQSNTSASAHKPDSSALKAGLMAGQTADELIIKARQYLGRPYKYGASGPRSFDCAGFAMFVYKQFGYELSRSSRTQISDGRPVSGDLSSLQKGDLLVFSGSRVSKTPGHIGIFMELTEDGKDAVFIHAARGGVQITRLSEPYYSARFLGARRILPDFIPAFDEINRAEYRFDPDGDVYVRADTLSLGSDDLRVVLFDNGKWAFIDSEGRVSVPPEGPAMVLYPGGDWRYIPMAGRTIPGTPDNAAAGTISGTPATPAGSPAGQKDDAARSTAAVAPVQPDGQEPVYHTIRSGDTLGKLAARYHTTVRSICDLNGISERTILRIGKKLRVK